MSKADYVRSQAAFGDEFPRHHCHWPDCNRPVPPAMWGCKFHWFKLPMRLRSRIWATYRPGQEISKTPSSEYLAVARDVQVWVAASGIETRSATDAERRGPKGESPTVEDGDAQQPNEYPHP